MEAVSGRIITLLLTPFNLEPRNNLIGLCRALPQLERVFFTLRLVLFGHPIFETMSAGACVVASPKSSMRDVMSDIGAEGRVAP
ncbi:MAG: hypothetical protein VYE68_01465 [Acidobacteriota bacterium]|nr:hypothetical protein [Acidobacteriota bacterium]